jgi:hypothetical protein
MPTRPSRPCLLLLFAVVGCGSSGSSPAEDASVDGSLSTGNRNGTAEAEAAPHDGGDGADAACPVSPPGNTGTCAVEGQTCSYDCDFCHCVGGGWICEAPGCAGGCLGRVGPPPTEGETCGGCCGPSYGDTCSFGCPGDAGSITATCAASGWHLNTVCGSSPDAGDGGTD